MIEWDRAIGKKEEIFCLIIIISIYSIIMMERKNERKIAKEEREREREKNVEVIM